MLWLTPTQKDQYSLGDSNDDTSEVFCTDTQVVISPSGERLAVLDLVGGVTVVELGGDAANPSPLGRRYKPQCCIA